MPDPLELNGLDGANPLGFLAALGTLALCERLGLNPRMAWRPYANSYRPLMWVNRNIDANNLASALCQHLLSEWDCGRPEYLYRDIIAVDPNQFRALLLKHIHSTHDQDPTVLALLSGYGSDAILQTDGNQAGLIAPSQISFANRGGKRWLLENYKGNVVGTTFKKKTYPAITLARLEKSLFHTSLLDEDHLELRWSPTELRPGALSKVSGTNQGWNALAFWSLAMLASFPTKDDLATTGFTLSSRSKIKSSGYFTMPFWQCASSSAVVRSILNQNNLCATSPKHADLQAMGIDNVLRCYRVVFEKCNYFTAAVAV